MGGFLLAQQAYVRGRGLEIAAKRVDVQTAPAHLTGVDAQGGGSAVAFDIHEHAFHTLLVEFGVVSVRDEVGEQGPAPNPRSPLADHHCRPVGLAGDRAVGFQQVRMQRLGDRGS